MWHPTRHSRRRFPEWPPTFHPHAELLYVIEGEIPVTIENVTHNVTAGEMAILFPYLPHSYGGAADAPHVFLIFEPTATAFDNTLLTQKPVRWWREAREFQPLLERMAIMHQKKRSKTTTGYLNVLLGELLEVLELEPRRTTGQNTAARILSYCEDHYLDDITVKSVADALYISESYVSKVFSNKLQCSFRDYINALRIQQARSLLLNTDKKIVDIMLECGFRNQGSFNRVFRKGNALSPGEYRAKMAKNR